MFSLRRAIRHGVMLTGCGAIGFSQSVLAYTLSDLVSIAATQHPAVKSRESLQAAAKEDVDGAWQKFLPTPSADYNDESGSVSLTQPMWWFSGVERPTYSMALARETVAGSSVGEARDSIAGRVVEAYSAWLRAVERIEVARGDIVYFDSLLDQINRRVNTGASAEIERELVVSRRLSTQGTLAASEADKQSAIEQLEQISNESLADDLMLSGKTFAPEIPEFATALNEAFGRSPTLQRLKYESQVQESELDVANEMLKPQLYLRAEHTWQDGLGTDQAVHLGVKWTPGAGLSGFSAVRAAGNKVSAAYEAEEGARRQVHEDMSRYFTQYQGTHARLELQLESLKTLIVIRDSYLRQFMAGRRQWQEVMNAVRDVSDARYAIADMRASLLMSGYQVLLLARGDESVAAASTLELAVDELK